MTQATLGNLNQSAARLNDSSAAVFKRCAWQAQVDQFLSLIARVLDQTQRRVFDGESVPAADKIVSFLEPHSDIIVKDRRAVHYGYKLNLTSGASGLIFDIVIKDGYPADGERFIPMLERHLERSGCVPQRVAPDGGYASQTNLTAAHQIGFEFVRLVEAAN